MFRLRTAQKKFRNVAFSPSALFQTGDILLWYDPSDLTTMFKDTAGTQPVTADGDAVALMLDKGQWGGRTLTQVLAAQPELVTNGTFDAASGWTVGSGWEILSGKATKTTPGTASAVQQNAGISAGKFYKIEFTVLGTTAGTVNVRVGTDAVLSFSTGTNGTYSFIAQAGSANALVYFYSGSTFNGSIDSISVKEIPGYHRIQATGTSMPKYKTDGTLHWLLYDGTDDGHATNTITWGTDEVAVCAGVTKSSDAAAGVVAELSASSSSNTGAFALFAPSTAATNYQFRSKGSTDRTVTLSPYASPITKVLTAQGDISADDADVRVDGVLDAGTPSGAAGTGNFGDYPLYFGRRGGSSLPFNGREYQTVIRSRLLSAAELSSLETFIAAKTGVTL